MDSPPSFFFESLVFVVVCKLCQIGFNGVSPSLASSFCRVFKLPDCPFTMTLLKVIECQRKSYATILPSQKAIEPDEKKCMGRTKNKTPDPRKHTQEEKKTKEKKQMSIIALNPRSRLSWYCHFLSRMLIPFLLICLIIIVYQELVILRRTRRNVVILRAFHRDTRN